MDVLSTLLSIKRHYSLTRHAKDAALFFNSINSRRAELHLCFEGSVLMMFYMSRGFLNWCLNKTTKAGENFSPLILSSFVFLFIMVT